MNVKKTVLFLGLGLLVVLAVVCAATEASHWFTALFEPSTLFAGGFSLAAMPVAFTEEQVKELHGILDEIKGGWAELKRLPEIFGGLRQENEGLRKDLNEVRRLIVVRGTQSRSPGLVSDDCARHLTGIALLARLRSGKQVENADQMHGLAKDILG